MMETLGSWLRAFLHLPFMIRARMQCADKICLAQPKISTKIVSRQIFNLVIVAALKNFFFRSCRVNCMYSFHTSDKDLSCSEAGLQRL